ncbi:MAG: hypothetical protein H7249_02600 [Chitinophagaceae bacterium]|nr:hypothetical protein [Oligoflexus sp.]
MIWASDGNFCGGVESIAGDSKAWANISVSGNGCGSSGECHYKDKISGLEWLKVVATGVYSNAANTCFTLNYDGVTG